MSKRLVYLRRAQLDLLEIVAYIRRDSPAQADRWLGQAERILSRLRAFPKSGFVPKDRRLAASGYRVVALGEHLAFYVVRRNTVQVRRVLHGKRRYSFLLGD